MKPITGSSKDGRSNISDSAAIALCRVPTNSRYRRINLNEGARLANLDETVEQEPLHGSPPVQLNDLAA